MLRADEISRMTAQTKRGIKDEVNILLQDKGLDNSRATVTLMALYALNLVGNESDNH